MQFEPKRRHGNGEDAMVANADAAWAGTEEGGTLGGKAWCGQELETES